MGATELIASPTWADWSHTAPFTVGIEEEVMLLDARTWGLAQAIDEVLPRLPYHQAARVTAETHAAAAELGTGVHPTIGSAVGELRELREAMRSTCEACGLGVASSRIEP